MIRKIFYTGFKAIITVAAFGGLNGCVKDACLGPCDPSGSELELSFITTVPSASTGTRSFTSNQEDRLDKVDVLVFDNNGTKYAYRTYGTVDPEGENNRNRIRVKVLPTGTDKHSYVLLGNLRKEIEFLFRTGSSINLGDPKEEVLQKITFLAYDDASGTSDYERMARRWNTTSPPVTYLPMWGDNGQVYTINTTNDIQTINTGNSIKMLRAVARVDVLFGATPAAIAEMKNKFLPKEILVYHANQAGHAVPLNTNLFPGQIKAQKPTIPTGTAYESILYNLDIPEVSDRYSIERMIYVNEHLNNATPALPNADRMGILIGGIYDETESGYFGSAPKTWYRVDFYHKKNMYDPQEIVDVLRNYIYRFQITKIEGHGYPDPGTAIDSEPLNIENDVLVWEDDLDMGEMKYDGFHYYSAAPLKFDHYLCRGNYKFHAYDSLVVKTNSPLFTHIDLDYDASKFSAEPFVFNREYDPITGQTTAVVRFAVDDIPHDPAGIENQYDIGIKFKDSPTGLTRVSFNARLTQNSRKPDIDIDTLVWVMFNNDPAGLLFNDTKGYILANGDFSFVNIRLTEEIGFLKDIYMPKRVSVTFMGGMNDWHDDSMTGTAHPSYDQFEHSMRIDLPVFGHNGFKYLHLPDAPYANMNPLWKVEYEQNTDKWVELPFSRPNWRMYTFALMAFSSTPFNYPKEQGQVWGFRYWGYFQEHPVMVAVKDGRHEGAQIITKEIIPPGNYPSSSPTPLGIWIEANATPRDLYVFFSLTGREEDLIDALKYENKLGSWEIYDGNRQY